MAVDQPATVNAKDLITQDIARAQEPNVAYIRLRVKPGGAGEELRVLVLSDAVGPDLEVKEIKADVAVTPVWSTTAISTTAGTDPESDSFYTPSLAISDDANHSAYAFWFGNNNSPNFAARMFYAVDSGAGWSAPVQIFEVPLPATGTYYLSGITIAELPGLGGVGSMAREYDTPGGTFAAYFEFAAPAAPTGLFPEYLKRRSYTANN